MFARKKPAPAKGRKHDLSQFGFTDISDDFDPTGGIDDDDAIDSDLEAELAAISGDGVNRSKAKPKPKLVAPSELDRMVADSMRDIGSDEESGDENDSDLLGELQDITGGGDDEAPAAQEEPQQLFLPTSTMDTISIIKERIEMYTMAEGNAKTAGEAAKARRFNRGLKTLKDLLKQASAGKQINVDDIPPEVGVKAAAKPTSTNDERAATTPPEVDTPKVPSRSAPPLPPAPDVAPSEEAQAAPPASPEAIVLASDDSDDPKTVLLGQLFARQKEYKAAALNYKRAGDMANALQFIKVVKQFDLVIKMCQNGQAVDLSDMPPPPGEFLEFLAKMQETAPVPPPPQAAVSVAPTVVEPTAASSDTTTPVSMLEALQQRLEKCKSVAEAAKSEGNASKARRWGRIVKQYEDAVKLYKAGRPVPYDELPPPPGFEPFPVGGGNEPNAAAPPPVPPKPASTTPTSQPSVSIASSPSSTPKEEPKRPSPHKQELTARATGNQQTNNLVEQQMKMLMERQKEFRVAAIEAKKAGEIDQAKEYLKIYKGFDALLNAASGGLPIDLTTLPVPPSQRDNLEASFAIVATDDCDPSEEDISDIGVRMEEQLAKQLMMCKNTRDHHKAMGDVAGMNRFENLALTVQKDLDLIRYSKRKHFPLPKFHYEKKSFNIVHCNTDLTDNEMEIIVVRGINYNVANPKEVDTYVRIEFPLLNDEVFKTKTTLIKDTDSPDYDQRFKVDIMRGNRQFQRIFKRYGVKFEVYSRGGFLRSDILIGTVNVKLQPLETKCDIHDTYDLMEGRKAVGGKLEIQIRVRNPILTKQMEHIDEKWLVLDS